MKFIIAHWQVILLIIFIAFISYIGGRGKKGQGEGAFSRIFKTNYEFDSSFALAGMIFITVMVLLAFHDDIKDKAGMIVLAFAIGLKDICLQMLTNKKIAQNGNGNGQPPP